MKYIYNIKYITDYYNEKKLYHEYIYYKNSELDAIELAKSLKPYNDMNKRVIVFKHGEMIYYS